VTGSLSGQTISVAHAPVRLNGALLECNGVGVPAKHGPTRLWNRYTCTQTLFENGTDRDVTFDVTILSATRLSISSPRYGPE
jgi:hypothetical protein